MKKIILLLALLLCYVASFCQLKTITNELDVKGKLKVSLDTTVKVFTRISLNDSSVQAATTAWVKKQLYGSNSGQGLFKRFAIPFGSSTGSLTQDSASFNFTTGNIYVSGAGTNSIILNNFRTEIQGSFSGFKFNVGSGFAGGGVYDASKSYSFQNRGNNYLTMGSAGAVHTSTFYTDLVINGTVKITGGVPGAGKVLTSDAVGLASWQVPSGGGGSTDTSSLSNRIDLKAAIASPTFTGFPAAPTQATGTSNTTLATTQFVQNSLAAQIQPAGTIFGNASITDAIPTFTTTPYIAGSLKIGTSAATDPSALLDLNSSTKGFLLPRMTSSNINAISSPATALALYSTNDSNFNYYDGRVWKNIGSRITYNSIGTTNTDDNSLILENRTAATAGLSQNSPAIVFKSSGWKTNATAGSRASWWRLSSQPIQSSTEVESKLNLEISINGSTFTSSGINFNVDRFGLSTINTQNLVTNGIGGLTSLTIGKTNSANTIQHLVLNGAALNATTGDYAVLRNSYGFAPTSGTTAFSAFTYDGIINTTGSYSGPVRGFYFNPGLTTTTGADIRAIDITAGKIILTATNTVTGTTGAQTINKISGKVNFVAGATSLVVTNNLVTSSSIIIPVVESATPITISYVPAAGSFTLYIPTQATETKISFMVIN